MDSPQGYSEPQKVVSPFANTQAVVSDKSSNSAKMTIWIVVAILLIAAGGFSGVLLTRYLNDPLRTLEVFPISKYLDSYHSLAGAKFKGQLRVEADLGWKDDVGHLMLFTLPEDTRPVAIMIPSAVANGMYFSKGQTYLAELEVKEGGLIYANSCKKN